ncbi:GNAT family N-acetyltransferase [Anaeropeptidivorans aminofermentans]|uniref:GNAT family N-acetyltransferase n=1 Tax=Anaeropeptidivorans aminofermentans TaxID=2934315 RepID=UPI002025494C|nr:GNAT family N-acetyltransferase [Anaeropeptidivorans aminofermentans]MBE6012351.1 GNAT family N-acetyltransferase [Lachnospiraceae bacterium]
MDELVLKEPAKEFEKAATELKKEYLENGEDHINGTSGLLRYESYDEWLNIILARYKGGTPSGVAASTYFTVRKSDGKIIGTIQLRHELDADLEKHGGHIGYGIRPSERKKGYGNKQLQLILEKAREIGLDKVMISCNKTNMASAKVIMKNGGLLTYEGPDEEYGIIQIYWINL